MRDLTRAVGMAEELRSVAGCGLAPAGGVVGWELRRREAELSLARLGCQWCRSTSVCLAHCSPLKRSATALVLRDGLESWLESGGGGSLVTVGLKHSGDGHGGSANGSDLAGMLELVNGTAKRHGADGVWGRMRRMNERHDGRRVDLFKDWRERWGVAAYFRVTEATWNPQWRWNVHLHVLVLLQQALEEELTVELAPILGGEVDRDLLTDDPVGWELVALWNRAADLVADSAGLGPLVTRMAYRSRGQIRGPNQAKRLATGGIADYLGKVDGRDHRAVSGRSRTFTGVSAGERSRWDIADELTSVGKRARGGGVAPAGILRAAIGIQPIDMRRNRAGEPYDSDLEYLISLHSWADWETSEGRARWRALYAEYVRVFHGRHVLQPGHGFWAELGVRNGELAKLDDTASLEEAADVVGGELLDRHDLGVRLDADRVNRRDVQAAIVAAERELRAVLREGITGRDLDRAIDRFCDRIGELVEP